MKDPFVELKKIYIKSWGWVDSIEMLFDDGVKNEWSPRFGGTKGAIKEVSLLEG